MAYPAILCSLQQEVVGLAAKLVTRAHVRGIDTPDDDDGERGRYHGEQPDPQAHAARAVYPTPRTVCTMRGSPFASVLRRM